jgi:hypothetical protein
VLAHDSRTLELSRYFGIPHVTLNKQDAGSLDARKIYEQADFTDLNTGHSKRLATFMQFAERNGLSTIFSVPGAEDAFDQRMDAVAFPPSVRALSHAPGPLVLERVRWLRARHDETLRTLNKRMTQLEAQVAKIRAGG